MRMFIYLLSGATLKQGNLNQKVFNAYTTDLKTTDVMYFLIFELASYCLII